MLYSRALIPTVKEAPADAANASHKLLVRGGYIRKVGAGFYDFLPLGLRVLRKIESIVREEMNRAGAQEILMPALLPAEYFKETGRWDVYGDTLFRLKDRKGGEFHLGPTHEEIVTDIARREIKSWRDMPMNLYQVQSKYRDEPRPRGGLLRCREFLMKDAYSFDIDEEGAKVSYEIMRKAYVAAFDRMALTYRMVAADPGAIGGSTSAEFQVLADSGEDAIVACDKCDYAANVEIATASNVSVAEVDAEHRGREPNARRSRPPRSAPSTTSRSSSASPRRSSSSRWCTSRTRSSSSRWSAAITTSTRSASRATSAWARSSWPPRPTCRRPPARAVGFAGPVGFKGKIVVDRAAAQVKNAATGANETDQHFTNVNLGRDWQGDVADIRLATTGDLCPNCEGGHLKSYKGIEGGHIFILGTRYSAQMGAEYSDEKQEKKPIVMGCYGIGVSRLVATAIEQNHDENGIKWPMSIAPYQVHLVTLGKEENVGVEAKKLYDALGAQGIDVLWDDRDERPGVKFKDADLLGMPLRITIGAKSLANGNIELKPRTEADPKKAELVPVADAARVIGERVKAALGR